MGFLSTSHPPTTASYNFVNGTYLGWGWGGGLLSNISDLQIPSGDVLIILGILIFFLYSEDPLSPSLDGIPLGILDGFLAKKNPGFDVPRTPSLTRFFCESEVHAFFLGGPSFTFGLDGNDASMLFLFSLLGTMLILCLGVFMRSSSRSGVKHVYFRLIFSGALIFRIHFTRYVQLGGIVTSLINLTV